MHFKLWDQDTILYLHAHLALGDNPATDFQEQKNQRI